MQHLSTTQSPALGAGRLATGLCLLATSFALSAQATPSPVSGAITWLALSLALVSGGHAVYLGSRQIAQQMQRSGNLPSAFASPTPTPVAQPSLTPVWPESSQALPGLSLPAHWKRQDSPDGMLVSRPDGRRFLVSARPTSGSRGIPVIVFTPGTATAPHREGQCWHLTGQPGDLVHFLEAL